MSVASSGKGHRSPPASFLWAQLASFAAVLLASTLLFGPSRDAHDTTAVACQAVSSTLTLSVEALDLDQLGVTPIDGNDEVVDAGDAESDDVEPEACGARPEPRGCSRSDEPAASQTVAARAAPLNWRSAVRTPGAPRGPPSA